MAVGAGTFSDTTTFADATAKVIQKQPVPVKGEKAREIGTTTRVVKKKSGFEAESKTVSGNPIQSVGEAISDLEKEKSSAKGSAGAFPSSSADPVSPPSPQDLRLLEYLEKLETLKPLRERLREAFDRLKKAEDEQRNNPKAMMARSINKAKEDIAEIKRKILEELHRLASKEGIEKKSKKDQEGMLNYLWNAITYSLGFGGSSSSDPKVNTGSSKHLPSSSSGYSSDSKSNSDPAK